MKRSLYDTLSGAFCASNLALAWLPPLRTVIAKRMEFDDALMACMKTSLETLGEIFRVNGPDDHSAVAWSYLLAEDTDAADFERAKRMLAGNNCPAVFLDFATKYRALVAAQSKWNMIIQGLDAVESALSEHLEHVVKKLSTANRLDEALRDMQLVLVTRGTASDRAKAFVDGCRKQTDSILDQRA